MHVYFVRHGETALNKRHMHQSPNTPLSPKGREDALTASEYLRGVNPERIFTSEYTRAQETARIIGSVLGKKPEVHNLFYEIIRPSKFYGKSHFYPETFWYVFLSLINRKNPLWRYTDAENFVEVSRRARSAISFLESLNDTHESVVVVSHTVFINLMVAYMCRNRILGHRGLMRAYLHIETMKNGEVTHLEYMGKGDEHTCSWRCVPHEKYRI